jgi:hypothetical protein
MYKEWVAAGRPKPHPEGEQKSSPFLCAGEISIRDQGALDLISFLLEQGRNVRIRVSGESMQPILMGGETVQIASLETQRPGVGELLLLYDQQGNPLIHRLIRRYSHQGIPYVQTKGDSCLAFDTPVPLSQVLGRVTHIFYHSESSFSTDLSNVRDLRAPTVRLKSFLIVVYQLIFFFLRRARKVWSA